MAHETHLKNNKYKQWVKAGLGLRYLQEGLAPFCDDIGKQQHNDIINKIQQTKTPQPNVPCAACQITTLQPDHVRVSRGICPLLQKMCNCFFPKITKRCPNNICGAIYDSIIQYHASIPPAPCWKNSDSQQWSTDPWSVCKCFINAPGYKDKTSAVDTDCTGLLQVIINNKYFHNHIGCNVTGPNNLFSKVRQYRNDIFHSTSMELEESKANTYIEDMIAVLQDGKELLYRHDAQQAVLKLQELKQKDFIINTEDFGEMLRQMKTEMTPILKDTESVTGKDEHGIEEHKKQLETQLSKIEEDFSGQPSPHSVYTDDSDDEGSDLELSAGNKDTFVRKVHFFSSPDKDEWVRAVERWESDKQLKPKTSKNYAKACVEQKGSMKITDKVKRVSDDDGWESDDSCKFDRSSKKVLKSKPWKKHKSKARAKTKRLFKRRGKKDASSLLKSIYGVCNSLASLFDDIASVFVATSPDAANDPVLVCLTTGECNDLPATFKRFKVIQKPFYPKTTKFPVMAESDENEEFKYDTKMFQEINETINYHAGSLMTKHTNLEAIKMSLVRSSKNVIKHEPCIVLLCRCKSYIPIGEPEFPKKLGHPSSKVFFPTDVREGYFKYCSSLTRDPSEWSNELAMGCSIGPENDGFSASLGPFINIQGTNQLCFLTVRHLFQPLSTPDVRLSGVNVVQPSDSDYSVSQVSWNNRRCGVVKVALLNDKIDAALVEIDPTRAPNRGKFVGIRTDDLDFAGFAGGSFPTYDDGCVRDARKFLGRNYLHDRIIKFGKKTGLRKGFLSIENLAARIAIWTGHIRYGSRIQSRVMYQQLQVDSFRRKVFFEVGDSGAAVFSVDKDNTLFCIGMAIGTMSDNTCVVTPIQNILEILGQRIGQTLELKTFLSESMDI